MTFAKGNRVRTPEGIETTVIGKVTDVIEVEKKVGDKVERQRIEVELVSVKLDGECVGNYPAERLELLADEEG
jgi:hypothetical protein